MAEGTRVAMCGRLGTVVQVWQDRVRVRWDWSGFSWVRLDDVSRVA